MKSEHTMPLVGIELTEDGMLIGHLAAHVFEWLNRSEMFFNRLLEDRKLVDIGLS